MSTDRAAPALVFGASGYVGRHLVPRLQRDGQRVRAAARRRGPMEAEGWRGVEIVEADALSPGTLDAALAGVETAWYLVHSMAAGSDFPARDRRAAANFAAAAARAGLRRIVYLGGLAPAEADTAHLASRIETGEILRAGPVPVTELRAGIIVGPGSAAFEVMRDLVAHLPVMITPRWIRASSPPVALDELLDDLVALARLEVAAGQIYEAGGPECLTYDRMMRSLARSLGRREPVIIPVPVLTPNLSSYWMALVSATPAPVARALISGLKYDLTADDQALRALLPHPRIGFDEAVRRVFEAERKILATDRLREGAFNLRGHRHDISFYGKTLQAGADSAADPAAVWQALSQIGTARTGYFRRTWLWRLRRRLDRLAGGQDAGPRPPDAPLAPGLRFDFWQVLACAPGRRLVLLGQLVAPAGGGMQFDLTPRPGGGCRLTATIQVHPAGFAGLIYWYLLAPLHALALRGTVVGICRAAEDGAGAVALRAPGAG